MPEKAKVLLITNVHPSINNPKEIFNLFSNYGDVARVKICRKKANTALVEFTEAKSAYIARNALDQYMVFESKMFVTFSKYDRIKLPSENPNKALVEDDGNTMDFSTPEFEPFRYRFKDAQHRAKNIKNAVKPSRTIQVINIPARLTADDIENFLTNDCGMPVFKTVAIRRKFGKADAQSPEGPEFDRHILIGLDFNTAVVAMAKLPGKWASEGHIGLKCFYTKTKSTDQHDKIKAGKGNGKDWEIIPNNQPIPPVP